MAQQHIVVRSGGQVEVEGAGSHAQHIHGRAPSTCCALQQIERGLGQRAPARQVTMQACQLGAGGQAIIPEQVHHLFE